MNYLITLFTILLSASLAQGQQYTENQNSVFNSILKNSGFESGRSSWVPGAGSAVYQSVSGNAVEGQRSGFAFLTSHTGTIVSQSASAGDCGKLAGQNLELSMYVRTVLASVEICSLQDGSEVQCQQVSSPTNYTKYVFNLVAVAGKSCGLSVKTTASVSGQVFFDKAYVGLATNVISAQVSPPTVQVYTSGSGTFTVPAGATRLEIEMVGGGGGGAGSGTASIGAGLAGSSTTFGTSLLTAGAGTGGGVGSSGSPATGGNGGAPTINSPAIALASLGGSQGAGGQNNGTEATAILAGGSGGSSCLGGQGRPSGGASTNSGSGGGGASGNNVPNMFSGSGGGSGACIRAVISSPLNSTYSYAVGTAGAGGSAGTNGSPGGAGAAGWILITVYYENQNVVSVPGANILGTVFDAGPKNICPIGSVKLDGSTLSGSQYAALIAYNGTAVLQNRSGLVARGTGSQTVNTRSKVGPTNAGDIQEDQMQGHTHHWGSNNQNSVAGSGSPGFFSGVLATDPTGGPITDGTNGTPRVGAETRVSAMGVTYCQWFVSQASQLIRGSVVTGSVGVVRTEAAKFRCFSTSAISSQSSSWISSIGNISSGACVISFASNVFSSAPWCQVTVNSLGSSQTVSIGTSSPTTTGLTVYGFGSVANLVDYTFDLSCMGPR
jgi:hypothetical protein